MKLTLDQVIVHYALRERKFMMDISKHAKADFFEEPYRTFYIHLHAAFLSPKIGEVLGVDAFAEYCKDKMDQELVRELYVAAEGAVGPEGKEFLPGDFNFFLMKLKERYNKRVADETAEKIKEAVVNKVEVGLINKIIDDAQREIKDINKAKVFDEGSLGDDIINIYKEYQAIKEAPELFSGISSGYPSLDEVTRGFHGGELIIVAGFEGSGKSLLCMNFAKNAWLGSNTVSGSTKDFSMDGKNVVYFSLEMPRSNRGEVSMGAYLNKRLVSATGGIDFSRLRSGNLDETEFDKFKDTCKFINEYDKHKKFYIVDIPRGASVGDIEVKYLEIIEKFPVDLVVIDYIGLMKGAEDESDWEAQGNIAAGLHELARVYNVPIVTPVQVNRPQGSGHSLNKQNYNTTRIARASGISQNANLVMQIGYRDNEHEYTDMPIHIIKARDGEKKQLTLRKDFACMSVYDDLAVQEEDTSNLSEFIDLGDNDD